MINHLYNYFLTQEDTKKQNYFKKWLQWQLYKYLRYALPKYYSRLSENKLTVNNKSNIVVSLTSIPSRINTVHLVIKSILNQSCKPLKIVLWLGEEHFPDKEEHLPITLINLKKKGLEIEFCKDLSSHTKYYYAFKKYSKNIIVTVDDDIIYAINMLEKLHECSKLNSTSVIANRVREITFTNGKIDHYRKWKINEYKSSLPSKKILATGVGGVLYQPNLFSKKLFDIENIQQLALGVDDIWLKASQLSNNVGVVWTNHFLRPFIEITESQETNLNSNNVFDDGNNIKINKIFSFFKISEATFK